MLRLRFATDAVSAFRGMAGRGADSASLCAGLPTRKCTSQRLKECLMSENQKVCRATGRPAWTCSAGGWKMTTSAVS